MRHILTTFLALHWAVVYALLAFICIDGTRGAAVALTVLGAPARGAGTPDLDNAVVAAPLATAFLVVAMLFCWAFVEALVNGAEGADSVIRVAFIAAGVVLSLILIGGSARGVSGLFQAVAVHLAALLTSYLAICAERWATSHSQFPAQDEVRAAARVMAKEAAHRSTLARISGRGGATPSRAD